MKQTKRFLALLLAFSMCLSMVTPAYASEIDEEPVIVETTEAVEDIDIDEEIIVDEEIVDDEEIISNEEIASEEAANEVDWDDATDLNANVDFVDFICVVTIAANTEKFYDLSSALGMELMADDEKIGIVDVDTDYRFSIKNDEAKEKAVILKLQHPVGSVENPEILYGLGENTATMFSDNYYYYSYTAAESSVLEFTFNAANDGAVFNISNQNSDSWSSGDAVNGVLSVQVTAGDVLSIAVAGSYSKITWNFNYAVGSALNPIPVEFMWNTDYTAADASVTVPAGVSYVFSAIVQDIKLYIDNVYVQMLKPVNLFEPAYFTITNETDAEKSYALHIEYPLGSQRNPEKFTDGIGACTMLEEGDNDGYYYSYTATAEGYVNVIMNQVTEGVEADIAIMSSGSSIMWNMSNAANGYVSVPVTAGDVLTFNVGCMDMNYPATEVSWSGYESAYMAGADSSVPVEITFAMNEACTEGDATVFVPAGSTYYFTAYDVGGMRLTVDGTNEQTLKDMPCVSVPFFVTNDTEEDRNFALHIDYPLGHKLNPAQLTDISLIQVSLEEGNADGYHYIYDLTEEGTVVLSGQDAGGVPFDVIITNLNSNLQNTMKDSGNGTVAMSVQPGDELHIQIVALPGSDNQIPAVDASVQGKFVYPVGHASNPEEIALGTVKATIEAETQGRYYKLTASKSGILMFKMNTESGWIYRIGNATEGDWNNEQTSDGGAAVSTIYVNKGDEVEIKVNTYNPKNPGSAPAGSVSFAVEMKKVDFEVISGKKLTLTFYDAAGKKVSGSKVDWSIEEAYVYDPDGNRVYFDNFDAYATMKSGALSTKACGDRIHMIVKGVLKTDKSVSTLYYVDIMPAANKLAIWTEEAPVYNNNLSWILNWQASKMKLNAFSHPVNANQKVTWTSSNKKVITIASDGTMRATGVAGKSTITATAADGSKKKASVVVEVVRYAEYIEIVRKDGKKLDDIQQICGFDEKGFPIYETVKGAVVDAGKSIQLKANVDPKASDKKVTWYTGSNFAKVSSSGKVTISKDAPDDYDVWVYAESLGYHQEFSIKVNNDKVTIDFWHLNDEDFYDGSVVWMESNNEVTFNITGLKANQIPTLIERGVEIDSNGIKVRDVKNYKLSGSKVVDMNIVYSWYHESGKQEVTDIKKVPDYVAEKDIYVDVKIKPKAGVTGKATITAVSADGKSKSVFTINVVNYPTKIQLTNKDGKKLWQEIYDYGTGEYTVVNGVKLQAVPGQTVTLKANTDVKQKVSWYAYQININRDGEYTGENQVKISNGKLTVPKDIVEETEIWVYADINRDKVNWKEAGTCIRVTPKASNLHIFAELNGTKYVSNTTKAFDINTDADGNGTADKALKLSAKVYPFSAGQKVTWSVKGASATIVTNKDGSATLKLTGKTGKATVTATANDGSKVKSTFTLDVVRPVRCLNLKTKLEVNAGKSLALAKLLTIDPANATNKKVTWSLKMKDQKGKLVDVPKTIATLSSSGSLATKKTAKGLTLYVTVTAQDGFGAMANTSVVVK